MKTEHLMIYHYLGFKYYLENVLIVAEGVITNKPITLLSKEPFPAMVGFNNHPVALISEIGTRYLLYKSPELNADICLNVLDTIAANRTGEYSITLNTAHIKVFSLQGTSEFSISAKDTTSAMYQAIVQALKWINDNAQSIKDGKKQRTEETRTVSTDTLGMFSDN